MECLRILLIDDDAVVARALQRMLRAHEVVIETESTVAVARIVAGEHFDVVVCDMSMPVMNGLDVLRIVRARREPPVFILASGADRVLPEGCRADGVLVKPFHASEFRDLIARLMEARSIAITQPLRGAC